MKFSLGLRKFFKRDKAKSSDVTDVMSPFSEQTQTSPYNDSETNYLDVMRQDLETMRAASRKSHRPGLEELDENDRGLYEQIKAKRVAKAQAAPSNFSGKEKQSRAEVVQYDSSKTVVAGNTRKDKWQANKYPSLSNETIDAIKETFDVIKESSRTGAREAAASQGIDLNQGQLKQIDKSWGTATRKAAEALMESANENVQLADQLNDIVKGNSDDSTKQKTALLKNQDFKMALSDATKQDKNFETDLFKQLFNPEALKIEKSGKIRKFTDKVTESGTPIRRPRAEKANRTNVPSPYNDGQKELMRQVTYNGPGAQDFENRANKVTKLGVDPRFTMPNGQTPKQFAIDSGDNKMAVLLQVIEEDYANKDLQRANTDWTAREGVANSSQVQDASRFR